jgi:hypothetical protein
LSAIATPVEAQHVLVSFAGDINAAFFGSETGSFAGSFSYNPNATVHDADGNFTNATLNFTVVSPILNDLYGVTGPMSSDGVVTYQSNWEGQGVDHMQFSMSFHGSPNPSSNFTIDLNLPRDPSATIASSRFRCPISRPPAPPAISCSATPMAI